MESTLNLSSLRDAFAANLNQPPVTPEPLQPPVAQVADPTPVAQPQADAAPPVEPVAEPAIEVDDFVLDLDAQPVVEPVAEPAAPQSRNEWEREFNFLKQNPRGQRILENHSHMQRLAAPPEEGGLGFKPEVEEIKTWHQSSSVVKRMMEDFTSGDPAANFAQFWFGPTENGMPMQGAEQIASALPEVLQQVNPQAYSRIGAHYDAKLVGEIQAMVASGQYSAEDSARLADAVKLVASIRGISASPQQAQQPATGDPEVERLRRENTELRSGQAQRVQSHIKQTVQTSLDEAISMDADAALAPLKNSVKDPVMYNALKRDLVAEMKQRAQSNSGIREQINAHLREMYRTGSTAAIDRVRRLWRQGYADYLPTMRSSYLRAAGLTVMQKAAAEKTIMQQAQDKTAPTSGAGPTNSAPVRGRQPNESASDYLKFTIHSALTGGRPS